LIATYRELVRVHSQLSDEVARYKNEIQALLSVLFLEFTQVTARPCRSTAVALFMSSGSLNRVSLSRSWVCVSSVSGFNQPASVSY
jgi:transposase